MSLAQEMWDYLKSIGFEDISNSDERLREAANCWVRCDLSIARNNLCAYQYADTIHNDNCIFLVDTSKSLHGGTDRYINAHSVADLEEWLRRKYPEFFTVEQYQYKVGDRVRILEDAIVYEGADVVQEYGALTAVGEIGVVNHLRYDGYIEIKDLPTECGSCWSYKPQQIEPYIEV